ncbi:MAG TPA: DUF1592 domain-containing protein [Planctomycetaceae bacterium]|jgi:hypothetical protein|nr:DUF1592 domain-containing protein [Planctomycetaceae bacterium]
MGIFGKAAQANDGPSIPFDGHARRANEHSAGAHRAFDAIGSEYAREIRPLMSQFCLNCHSTAKHKGDLDLERFSKLDDVRRGTKVWLKVAEMLDNGEMPPEKSRRPSAEQRKRLRGWVERYLHAEALANAGDPGPVVLRRLSNAEYTYTIRDLTGVDLNPAREFPTDGAAGEGFTNAGNALVMSPALLTKYFDAGREIGQHAVLLPDGFRFSPSTSRSDWTNEVLSRVRALYREHSDTAGASQVNLQGIVFRTNEGGRLPIERYLAAAFDVAVALGVAPAVPNTAAPMSGPDVDRAIAAVTKKTGLNAKYLGILWSTLNDRNPSLSLDAIRAKWRGAKREDIALLAAEINQWQKALWRFTSVGHIGKVGGPKAWQEPVNPLAAAQEVRVKLPAPASGEKNVTLFLVASDAGDGNVNDFVVWQRPRLVAPGGPELLLRDVRSFTRDMTALRDRAFASTAQALVGAAEAGRATGNIDVAALAKTYGVDVDFLSAWLDYLGIGFDPTSKLDHFATKLQNAGSYDFIKGWGTNETPLVLANSSQQNVRVPGNMKSHSVCVHPSPTLYAAVGWRSPIAGTIQIKGKVVHAHPECGNGVVWRLEFRRGATRQRLAEGRAQGSKVGTIDHIKTLAVQPGDLVSLLVGPRDGNHACDLTELSLVLTTVGASPREWSLTQDVSSNILAGNPHADRFGNEGVWHFYTEPVKGSEPGAVIPPDSLLARWQTAATPQEKQQLAMGLQKLLTGDAPNESHRKTPDAVLYRQLTSLGGPLFLRAWPRVATQLPSTTPADAERRTNIGIDPAQFGKHPNGSPIEGASLCVQAPSVVEVHLPADFPVGTEFVTVGSLHPQTGGEGSVQVQVLTARPKQDSGLRPISVTETTGNGPWTSNNRRFSPSTPIVVNAGSAARRRIESSFDQFRAVFPLALCYTKIVPVDEVVTLTLYYREDEPLRRLMLDDEEARRLDRLWEELHFISRDALKLVDAFLQLLEYASQDADPKVFEPMRKPINDRAAAFKKALVDAEPRQVDALMDFAARAYRRTLADFESKELHGLYRRLRQKGLSHDEAFRFTLARVFISPDFLYRRESAPAGPDSAPVSDWELASRLSYFLWSSQPDAELRAAAANGSLHQPEVLAKQARRLLGDARIRRLATEFACQWLQIYDFDSLSEKSEQFFPEFTRLRGDMHEESILFFTDLFQRDASVLGILDSDQTFVNERLARFYGIADRTPADGAPPPPTASTGNGWRRVEGIRRYGRGGILALSATLAKQSGASRTSPILRGNWVSEVLLGEKLPKPPKDVPRLPESETATDRLTVRQLVERHVSDRRCSSCHQKFDALGFALEGFDAIGRLRDRDLAGHPIDTKTRLPDGNKIDGLAGLRDYLAVTRRNTFVHQFCRKLLGYALGRGLQLSDEPLLAEMQQRLSESNYRFSAAIDTILESRQFREIRGRDSQSMESP